jgi:hypothetical protein
VGNAPVVAECYLGRRERQIGLVLERRGFRGIGLIDKLAPVGQICGGLCTLPPSPGPSGKEEKGAAAMDVLLLNLL